MSKPIFICAIFTYDAPDPSIGFPVIVPYDRQINLNEDIGLLFSTKDNKLNLKVSCGFENLISDRRYSIFEKFDASGVNIDLYNTKSNSLDQWVKDNANEWYRKGKEIFQFIRWSYNASLGDGNTSYELGWSFDRRKWNSFNIIKMGESEPAHMVISINFQKFRSDILNPKLVEPSYFAVLREAESNLYQNPKSSLLLAVVALETGMKQFLIAKNNALEVKFSSDNPPTLYAIFSEHLKEYEPALEFNEESLEIMNNIISERNKFVHMGIYTLSPESLLKRFKLIKDILYLLDFFSGIKWFNQDYYKFGNRLINERVLDILPDQNIGEVSEGAQQRFYFNNP